MFFSDFRHGFFFPSDIAKETTDAIATFGKPYIVSISGLSLSDNLEMLNRLYDNPSNIAAIELNLACPNIPGKPVVSNDFEQMENVLRGVTEHPKYGTIPLGIKLGPYFDMPFFERAADIIAQYPIRFIVCINTIGNALFVDADNECVAIAPQNGLGGLGGGFVKQTALANVRTMYQLLTARDRADIDIIGVGGVCTGRDAFELILCGARAVQTATCYWNEGPACFGRIALELEDIMRSKGYHSIEDFRGKLKPYIKPARTVQRSGEVNEGVDLDLEHVRPGTGRAAKVDNTTETKEKDSHAQAQQQLPWRELAIFAYLVLFAIIVAFGVENQKKHGHALKDSV